MNKHPARRYRWAWASAAALSVCLVFALFALGPWLIARQLNQMDLPGLINAATGGGSFSSAPLTVRLLPRPQIIVIDGQLSLPGKGKAHWKKARIFPSLVRLLVGQIKLNEISINQPSIHLNLPKPDSNTATVLSNGKDHVPFIHPLTIAELPLRLSEAIQWVGSAAPLTRIKIRNGEVQLQTDQALPFILHNGELDLRLEPDTLRIDLRCQSSLWGALALQGKMAADDLRGTMDLRFQDLQTTPFVSLLSGRAAFERFEGRVSGTAFLEIISASHIETALSLKAPTLIIKRLEKPLAIESLALTANLTLQEKQLTIRLQHLETEAPPLSITGSLQANQDPAGLRIDLAGHNLDLSQARQATLALAGDDETVRNIFDVLRAGSLRYVAWHTQGRTVHDLGRFRNMIITGEIQNGALFIPGAELELSAVSGAATISQGRLTGEDLRAQHGTTTGHNGHLWLDLDHPTQFPFTLKIDVEADLAQLPPLLRKWTKGTAFANELAQIPRFSGQAQGQLQLDGRRQELAVAVDVAQCRIEAAYSRIPLDIEIDDGQVHYTGSGIAVERLRGRLGHSRFAELSAHIGIQQNATLQISSGRADFDLKEVLPWISQMGALASLKKRVQVAGTTAHLKNIHLQGPLFDPARWRFKVGGQIAALEVKSSVLPAPLHLTETMLEADQDSLVVSRTKVKILDADLSAHGQAIINNQKLQSYSAEFGGPLGPLATKWLSTLARSSEALQVKPPLEVSRARFAWAIDQALNVDAAFKTGGGVEIILAAIVEQAGHHREQIQIHDDESQATVFLRQAPAIMEFTFQGTLSGKTLGRMLTNNPLPSGQLKGDFQALLHPSYPDRSEISGHLSARNMPLPLNTGYAIHISQIELQAEAKHIRILPSAFLVNGSWHTLEGEVRITPRAYQLDLRHTAAHLELSRPQTTPTPPEDKSSSPQWLTLPIEGQINSRINSLRVGEYRWTSLVGQIRPKPGRWVIALEEADLCGLQTKGTLTLTPQTASFEMAPRAHDALMDTTLTCLLAKPGLIDGRFKLKGTLQAEGPYDAMKQKLGGQVKFSATEGRIHRFNLLGRVLAVINLTEVVRGRIPDLMNEGLAYRRIDINTTITDGIMQLDKAVIDGDSVEIAAEGTIDLNSGQTDLIVLVAPLKTVDAIVKNTPIVNTWLGGTLVSIPVRVTGPFADPEVTPLSPTAVGSSVLNLLKNTVQLPIKLVEPLFKEDE